MGLRLKIIAALLGILLALAIAGSAMLRWEMERSFQEREHIEATGDMRRLLLTFEAQLTQLDLMLGSWANWSEMYAHAQHPSTRFSREEVSAEAIHNSHFDWLILADPTGKIIDLVEVPQPDGQMPLHTFLNDSSPLQLLLPAITDESAACGLVQIQRGITLLCFRPLHKSDGQGPTYGTVIVGRWLGETLLAAVRNQTKLDFSLELNQDNATPTKNVSRDTFPPFSQGAPAIVEHPDYLTVRSPFNSITGRPIGNIALHWPRTTRLDALDSMNKNQWALFLVIAITGMLMLLVIDRLVVHRLRHMRDELANIRESTRWEGQVSSHGKDEIADLANYINGNLDLIRTQMAELHNLSMTDTLTSLPNRRRFDEQFERAVGKFQRSLRPMALALIDIDSFKRYNDTYGHPAGDAALARVAHCLRDSAQRPGDLPARIGGEEFAIVLEDTDLHGARECIEATRQQLLAAAIEHSNNSTGSVMTLSCGIAIARQNDTPDTLYSRADTALYEAKAQGRNRVCVEAPAQVPMPIPIPVPVNPADHPAAP